MLERLRRLCLHPIGWSYNTHRRRRWCRLCGQQQRRTEGSWVDVDPIGDLYIHLYDRE